LPGNYFELPEIIHFMGYRGNRHIKETARGHVIHAPANDTLIDYPAARTGTRVKPVIGKMCEPGS
jgi:hypothetical protein